MTASTPIETSKPFAAFRAMKPSRIFVVLPAYNEEDNIGGLIESIGQFMSDEGCDYAIVVVDDGSTDATAAVVERAIGSPALQLIRHAGNQGLGATIRDGLFAAAAHARDEDIIVTMDADETHRPGLIASMVRQIRAGRDVVIASRYQRGAQVIGLDPFRKLMSLCASMLFRTLFPTPGVRDYTCGYRAYRADVIKQAISRYGPAFIDQTGFQCMVDILLKLRNSSLVFGEVPLVLRYDLKKSRSKMDVLRTAINTLRLILRRRIGR